MLSELRDRVRAVELEREAERGRTRRRVLGRRAVLAQSWRSNVGSVDAPEVLGAGFAVDFAVPPNNLVRVFPGPHPA